MKDLVLSRSFNIHVSYVALKFEFLCGLPFVGFSDFFLLFDNVFIQRQKVDFGERSVLGWVTGCPEKLGGLSMKGHSQEAASNLFPVLTEIQNSVLPKSGLKAVEAIRRKWW